MNTRSWRDGGPEGGEEGTGDVRKIVLELGWDGGRRKATIISQEHRDVSDVTQVTLEQSETADVTLLLPFG